MFRAFAVGWLGALVLVATPVASGLGSQEGAGGAPDRGARLFEEQIAPLLARHCLECHDAAVKKGGLDLSRRANAREGGDGGPVVVPGDPVRSPLWASIASDEMPKKRPPLQEREKAALRAWIQAGAEWSLDVIDPALYAHQGRASELWVQRLTRTEYVETVRGTLGVDVSAEAERLLPPDLRADGFRNTAYNLGVDLAHVDAYARLAATIVGRMDVVAFAGRFSRSRTLEDKEMRELIAGMGLRILRGPLEDREIALYRGLTTTVAASGGDFKEAVALVLEAMLQSPRFLYRVERQRGDGRPRPVAGYELASRLSYILWGAPPDEELLRAAGAGALAGEQAVAAQAERMLKDPRAVDRSLQFVREWLNLDRLLNLKPDPGRFPGWDARLGADMRDETLAFFKEIVWERKRPLAELLNAQVTYATPRLAKHYGLEPAGEGLRRYDLSSTPARGGLLTQGSVLTMGGDDASMVTRGLFVLHEILRGMVKEPPPGTDTTPVPSKPGVSQRVVSEARIADRRCGGCHGRFEPLAFGLERYDGLGGFAEKDRHGNALREDGALLVPGEAQALPYRTAAELMDFLAGSDRVRESLTWKIAQFALGRPLGSMDARAMEKVHAAVRKGGGTYPAVMKAIVTSELVLWSRTESKP